MLTNLMLIQRPAYITSALIYFISLYSHRHFDHSVFLRYHVGILLGSSGSLAPYLRQGLLLITLLFPILNTVLEASVQFSSVTQSCPTLCDPMNRSTPGLPVHHHLPEFTQTHVHRVRDAIQPSHPLSSPSPPAPNPSQHQSLFQ